MQDEVFFQMYGGISELITSLESKSERIKNQERYIFPFLFIGELKSWKTLQRIGDRDEIEEITFIERQRLFKMQANSSE